MKINVIFVTGKVGAGKDTILNRLVNRWNFTCFFYATHLKNTLKFGGWDGEKNLKGRKLLQKVGIAFREYDEDIWVNYLQNYILNFISLCKKDKKVLNIIIGDARHPNEITVLSKYFKTSKMYEDVNLLAIRVVGPNRDIKREMDESTTNDISETGLDNFDFDPYCKLIIVQNDGTIQDLYNKIDEIAIDQDYQE